MFNLGATAIIWRAAAFSGTLLLSFAILNFLPSARVRRQTHFARAAADGNLKQMRLLHMAGVNVNSHGACCSPLFLAAGEGRLDAVRYLLDQGADVNAREYGGRTPLTEAAFSGNASVIKELLLRGADMNAVSDAGTPLDVATQANHAPAIDLLKHYGAKRGCELRGGC
ncbi:MAG: ankyrin repeat domain-containing protein [Pyrinomonadaceae bacterium]